MFDFVGTDMDGNGSDKGNFRGEGEGVSQFSTQGDFSPGVICCEWGNLVWWNGRRILEVGVVCEIVGVILCGSVWGSGCRCGYGYG